MLTFFYSTKHVPPPFTYITPYMKRAYERQAVQKVLAKEEMLNFIPA